MRTIGTRLTRVAAGCMVAVGCAALAQSAGNGGTSPPTPQRFEPLASELTLEGSIDMLGGAGFSTHAVPRLGIPAFSMSDGPSGIRSPGPSTAFAAGIGLAATWDPTLAQEVGRQLGRDARARGSRYLLGPGVNIYRAPMNGRNFEYFGEDPWLSARIAVGYIQGVQEQGVSATVKHFAGNNSEFARHTSDSIIDERALREIYLPVFEAAVKEAHVGAVMSSYNLTNGQHMSANASLARDILRKQWGFDGVLMSDWGGTYDGVAASIATQDLEMPTGRFTNRETLMPAVRAGTVSTEAIRDMVRRQLRLADRFGWATTPAADLSIPRLNPAGGAAAYRGALEGAVLLKNDRNVLPLDASRIKSIAVIGPDAHPTPSTAGGSGHVPAFSDVSVLTGLSRKLGTRVRVTYAPGVAPAAIQNALTRFTTAPTDGRAGVNVEVFDTAALTGEARARRVEPSFATATGGLTGALSLFDWLPPGQTAAAVGSLINAPPEKTFERWTGYYTPPSAGEYSLSVQASGSFRLFIDDTLVIDASRVRKAALQQVTRNFSATAHKVVFEQGGSTDFGRPTWRVNVTRQGSFVQPLAKQLAAQSDAAIVVVGFDEQSESEGSDREFALPPGQDELIREVAAVNPNTIVVVVAGGAVDVRPWIANVAGLFAVWYPGEQGGAALADLLMGDASPSGRLPISWERAPEDNPTHDSYYYNDAANPDRIVYREGVFVGYRGYQKAGRKPQFPFGYGLGYSTFSYSNLSVTPVSGGTGLYTVRFDVTNTGSRPAADVAQLYIAESKPRIARPPRELKGFARTELEPGATRTVTLPLDARSFSYFDVAAKRWRANSGEYQVEIGRSSEDIAARSTVRISRELWEKP